MSKETGVKDVSRTVCLHLLREVLSHVWTRRPRKGKTRQERSIISKGTFYMTTKSRHRNQKEGDEKHNLSLD